MFNQNWPSYTLKEILRVKKVLSSNKVNYWTGNECRDFEKNFSQWTNSKYSIALANGTVALELALKAFNLSNGDEVIVTPRSFIASVSAVITNNAIPVFADIDPRSGNISPESIEKKISSKTKGIICVHMAGWPCDMEKIMAIAKLNNLFVIEDCAQAHGAKINGKSVGTIGDVGAWSFCQDKIMSTGGEGGMITTNNEKLWDAIWSFKDHGKTIESVYNKNHPEGFRWQHDRFGTNSRMTEMQAAIGNVQLTYMKKWHKVRKRNALIYHEALQDLDAINSYLPNEKYEHAWYKYYAYLNPNVLRLDYNREKIIENINSKNIFCQTGGCSEIYLERAFDNKDYKPKQRLENAKKLTDTSLMFLIHPTISRKKIFQNASEVRKIIVDATK
tara:strand:+ start:859 stop:2025 length:1167 start_codon:yes stop_codon:yes gene_type:complete